ncbi:hypothetical protein L7F22_042431 [Adiantum nelumboides]|nr:hypothetical protein [Adiantum nelumboides]
MGHHHPPSFLVILGSSSPSPAPPSLACHGSPTGLGGTLEAMLVAHHHKKGPRVPRHNEGRLPQLAAHMGKAAPYLLEHEALPSNGQASLASSLSNLVIG